MLKKIERIKKILIKGGNLLINFFRSIPRFSGFFILLLIFLWEKVLGFLTRIPLLGILFIFLEKLWKRFKNRFSLLIEKIDLYNKNKVRRSYLINLAYKNLMAKKVRSLVTIFGMSIAVGIIVFLLSLGYGIEKLVINRVASLDELKVIDVSAGENTVLRLSREMLKKIKKISFLEKIIPVVSLVGRVSYQKASTDVLVYAVPNFYLELSKIKIIKGRLFAQNNNYDLEKISFKPEEEKGQVAGLTTNLPYASLGEKISENTVSFNIKPEIEVFVWEDCSVNSKMLGYTTRLEGGYQGVEYWGGDYYPFSEGGRSAYDKKLKIYLGRWIKAKIPLYQKDINDKLFPILDDYGRQKWETVCLPIKNIQKLEEYQFAEVLGESTFSANTSLTNSTESAQLNASELAALTYEANIVSSDSSGLEYVVLQASSSAEVKKISELKLTEDISGQAIVSKGFLNLLNINLNKAVNKTFKVKYIITKNLSPDIEGKIFTSEVNYKIIGVVDDSDSSYFYIPFSDVDKLAIKNFSQLKVVVKNKETLPKVRKEIEVFGLKTTSVVDTVKQIESLFGNLRIVLVTLGMVALGIASLGMFNTLTVSLLERIREIGGMKVMGMVSDEVEELFLAEAMIMGLAGGVGGLILGFLSGKLVSFLVSLLSISQGQGYLELTYLPGIFILVILIISFIVGVTTGLYPAERAKKTSALNALKYE